LASPEKALIKTNGNQFNPTPSKKKDPKFDNKKSNKNFHKQNLLNPFLSIQKP
jgi:hypothetical protein